MSEEASTVGAGYSEGMSSLAGGILMYRASIVYLGTCNSSTPDDTYLSEFGDSASSYITNKMSVHKTADLEAASFEETELSITEFGVDKAMSAIRMFHGANDYCSSAYRACIKHSKKDADK